MELIITDGGRRDAGYKGYCGDSVVRAIAIAAKRPYKIVYNECAEMNANYYRTFFPNHRLAGVRSARDGVCTEHAQYLNYMKSMDFVWHPPRRRGRACKLYLEESDIPMGRLIVALSNYWVAVIDGSICDNRDPRNDFSRWPRRRVFGWWMLENAEALKDTLRIIRSEKEINHDYENC